MKRWAIIITLTYALLWLVLAFPVTWTLLEYDWGFLQWNDGLTHADIFGLPIFWGIMGVFVLAQTALLTVPVAVNRGRSDSKRHILWPMLAVTFLLANLVYWGINSLAVLAFDFESVFQPSGYFVEQMEDVLEHGVLANWFGWQISLDRGWYFVAGVLFPIGLVWLVWGLVFYKYFWRVDAESWLRRWLRNLVRGSVLELLILLPTHLAIRNKNECCAAGVSFAGIVTGLAVMLTCFGPGVMFLYLDRARRLRSGKKTKTPNTSSTSEVDETNRRS